MNAIALSNEPGLGRTSRPNPSRASICIATTTTQQTSTAETTYTHTSRLTLAPHNNNGYFVTTTPFTAKPSKRKRTRIYPSQPSIPHHDTKLDLPDSNNNNNESDLWILPDFDEWEADAGPETPLQEMPAPPSSEGGNWTNKLLARAVNSNRERLRRRLEGDGWDFVGGKYGDDGKLSIDVDAGSEESVDDEFDVVVLPMVEVSC
jgi:hypothetical protein